MTQMFPFGFESHLTFYLVIYVLSLVVHVFLMAYVLAGSLWLAWATLFPGHGLLPRTAQPLSAILRDWMPFALSGAITAGVAPLLFVQILYRQQFYSANLLLGWRWMVVIPVLVAGFYLLYVVKSKTIHRLAFPVRVALSICVAACFLFVAFCWTANHLLSLNATMWPEAYRSGKAVRSVSALLLRLGTWVAGTFPVMSILASWQLRGMSTRTARWDESISDADWKLMFAAEYQRLAIVSLAGLIVSSVLAVGYMLTLDSAIQDSLTGTPGRLWLLILFASVAFQAVGWRLHLRQRVISVRWLCAMTLVLTIMLVSTASLREIIRLLQADLNKVLASTQAAAKIGGFSLFVLFTIVNSILIAWCIRLVSFRKTQCSKDAE